MHTAIGRPACASCTRRIAGRSAHGYKATPATGGVTMRGASIMTLASALAAGVLAVACGSGNAASPTADAGESDSSTIDTGAAGDTGAATDTGSAKDSGASDVMEAAGYPAFTPNDVPQVVDSGGPVMTAPKVLPIFYAQDDSATVTSLNDFLSKLPGSTYWKSWATEYGVGDVTILAPATLPRSDE